MLFYYYSTRTCYFKTQLGPVVGTLHDKSVCADSEVKSEMERWHQSKKKDFRKVFIQMAKGYVTYYTQVSFVF